MRKHSFLIVFIAAVGISLLPGCGGDPDPGTQETEKDRVLKLLIGTWSVQSVTVDGVDRTSVYQSIQVTISAGTISASNGELLWPSSVGWSFTNDNATQIARGDGLTLNLVEVQQNKLKISFTWTKDTFGTGRATSVKGQHEFVFVK